MRTTAECRGESGLSASRMASPGRYAVSAITFRRDHNLWNFRIQVFYAERYARRPLVSILNRCWCEFSTAGEKSGAGGCIAVRVSALEQMPQAVAGLLEGIEKFVDFLGFAGHFSGVDIGDEFVAEVCGAANAVSHEQRNNFAVIPALELKFPQLLNRQGGRAKRVDGVAEFVQQTEVDAFSLERFFKLLQFDTRLFDLKIHAPKAVARSNQLD